MLPKIKKALTVKKKDLKIQLFYKYQFLKDVTSSYLFRRLETKNLRQSTQKTVTSKQTIFSNLTCKLSTVVLLHLTSLKLSTQ